MNVFLLIYLILSTQHISRIYRGVMIYKCLYICYYIRTYDKIKHQSGRFTDSNEGQSVCFLENKFVSKNDSRVLISGTTRYLSTERPEKMLFSCRLFFIYANVRHIHIINFKASLPFYSINIFSYYNHSAFYWFCCGLVWK